MLADLDLLLTAVFCTADDLLPEGKGNARRKLTDAEVEGLWGHKLDRPLNSGIPSGIGFRRPTGRSA
jgi:hypothetical protein